MMSINFNVSRDLLVRETREWAVKCVDSRMACFPFEQHLWVDLGVQDALRLTFEQVDRMNLERHTAIKRLWRRLDADAESFDPE